MRCFFCSIWRAGGEQSSHAWWKRPAWHPHQASIALNPLESPHFCHLRDVNTDAFHPPKYSLFFPKSQMLNIVVYIGACSPLHRQSTCAWTTARHRYASQAIYIFRKRFFSLRRRGTHFIAVFRKYRIFLIYPLYGRCGIVLGFGSTVTVCPPSFSHNTRFFGP